MPNGIRYHVSGPELARVLGLPENIEIVGVEDHDLALGGNLSFLLRGSGLPEFAPGALARSQYWRRPPLPSEVFREQIAILLGVQDALPPSNYEPEMDPPVVPPEPVGEQRGIFLDDVLPDPPAVGSDPAITQIDPNERRNMDQVRILQGARHEATRATAAVFRVEAPDATRQAIIERAAAIHSEQRQQQRVTQQRLAPTTAIPAFAAPYEQHIDRLWGTLRRARAYPLPETFAIDLGMSAHMHDAGIMAWLQYALDSLRLTWIQYQRDQQDIALGASPYRVPLPTQQAIPGVTLFVPPIYDVVGVNSLRYPQIRNRNDFSSADLVDVDRLVVRRHHGTDEVTIESLLHADAPPADLVVMNHLGAHPEIAGTVQCRWCAGVVAYDGRSRLCRNCGGLL